MLSGNGSVSPKPAMVRNDLFDGKGQRGTDTHRHYDMWALVGGAYRDSQFNPLIYSHFLSLSLSPLHFHPFL